MACPPVPPIASSRAKRVVEVPVQRPVAISRRARASSPRRRCPSSQTVLERLSTLFATPPYCWHGPTSVQQLTELCQSGRFLLGWEPALGRQVIDHARQVLAERLEQLVVVHAGSFGEVPDRVLAKGRRQLIRRDWTVWSSVNPRVGRCHRVRAAPYPGRCCRRSTRTLPVASKIREPDHFHFPRRICPECVHFLFEIHRAEKRVGSSSASDRRVGWVSQPISFADLARGQ